MLCDPTCDVNAHRYESKALGKLGNIVAETLCFLSMFPCLPTWGKIVAETKFASQEAKIISKKFRIVFVAETMFPGFPHMFSNVSSTKNIVLGMLKHCSVKTIVKT